MKLIYLYTQKNFSTMLVFEQNFFIESLYFTRNKIHFSKKKKTCKTANFTSDWPIIHANYKIVNYALEKIKLQIKKPRGEKLHQIK